MKVSIIITVYNLASYIGKAIESCLSQDYSDIEVIVVNDGSTDESEQVIKRYLSDSRVKYVSQTNGGVSSARNTGISNATGEYITFLDGDDYLSTETISSAVRCIENSLNKIDWLLFPMIRVDESGVKINNVDKGLLTDCRYTEEELIDAKELFKRYEQGKVAPCVCGGIYSRSFFDVKFPPGRFEDTYVFLSLMQHRPNILISPKGSYYYVDRGDSFIRTNFDAQKWYDYTRTRIMHIKTGLHLNPEQQTKYYNQASKTYYNLKYLKNKWYKDEAYGAPLQFFLSEFPDVKKSLLLSAKCTIKSVISRIKR